MSAGREFHVCGSVTENARRASSVRILGTVSSGASDDRRGRAETVVWIRSPRYAGIDDVMTLNVVVAILYLTRCLTGSQWSDLRLSLIHI